MTGINQLGGRYTTSRVNRHGSNARSGSASGAHIPAPSQRRNSSGVSGVHGTGVSTFSLFRSRHDQPGKRRAVQQLLASQSASQPDGGKRAKSEPDDEDDDEDQHEEGRSSKFEHKHEAPATGSQRQERAAENERARLADLRAFVLQQADWTGLHALNGARKEHTLLAELSKPLSQPASEHEQVIQDRNATYRIRKPLAPVAPVPSLLSQKGALASPRTPPNAKQRTPLFLQSPSERSEHTPPASPSRSDDAYSQHSQRAEGETSAMQAWLEVPQSLHNQLDPESCQAVRAHQHSRQARSDGLQPCADAVAEAAAESLEPRRAYSEPADAARYRERSLPADGPRGHEHGRAEDRQHDPTPGPHPLSPPAPTPATTPAPALDSTKVMEQLRADMLRAEEDLRARMRAALAGRKVPE